MATRWKAVLVSEWRILVSTEFNGDMYPDWLGDEMLWLLRNDVFDKKTFESEIKRFNSEYHKYEERLVWSPYKDTPQKRAELFTLDEGYIDKWFSDYLFVKNMTDEPLILKTWRNENLKPSDDVSILVLEKWQVARFHYWSIVEEDVKDGFYARQWVKTLSYEAK